MFVQLLPWMVPLLFLNRRDQCLRIIALQQQLEVYQRQQGGRRLQLTDQDRRFWVMLRRRWPRCGIRTVQIPKGRPQCNCYVERLMRTLRQECLRHLIILDERHPRWVLQECLAHYHRARPHQGLNQDTPLSQPRLLPGHGIIRCHPILGGLHHEYSRAAA